MQQLASDIRGSAIAGQPVKELLGLLIEDAKDSLVSSVGLATVRFQGEAQAYSRLLKMITVEPPSIKRPEGDSQ